MRRSHSRQHDHEFLGEEEPDIDFDGEYIHLYERCVHAPILDSVTDDRRDETYTVTGDRCEAQRTTCLKMEATSSEGPVEDWTDVVWRNRDEVEAYVMGHFLGWNADREGSFTLIHDDVEYQIDIAVDERTVVE